MKHAHCALEIQRLTAFVKADAHASALGRAVQSLLLALDFGASLIGPERAILKTYANACGPTYGDPEVGAAIHSLLSIVDREGMAEPDVGDTFRVPSGRSSAEGTARLKFRSSPQRVLFRSERIDEQTTETRPYGLRLAPEASLGRLPEPLFETLCGVFVLQKRLRPCGRAAKCQRGVVPRSMVREQALRSSYVRCCTDLAR
jgi:hypothetical protein